MSTTPTPMRERASTAAQPVPLNTAQATLLVAEREITTQAKSKAFVISMLVMAVIVIGGIVAMDFFGGEDGEPDEVAVVGLEPEAEAYLEEAALSPVSAETQEEAEELLREGEVDAIVTASEDSPVGLHVIGLDSAPIGVAQSLSVQPTMETLEADDDEAALRVLLPMAFGLVFMLLGIGSGTVILQNTIQEKQSRVVEILLASISARALLAGKILGNTTMALAQAAVIALATVAGLLITGQSDVLSLISAPMMWFVVFFIPGFVLVAALFAAGASLVSRQEDSGPVMTPAMMLVMIPYFIVLIFAENQAVMTVASYVPFTSAVAMPVRMFFGEVAWFEPVASLALMVLTVLLVTVLAARIYSRSLLRMGQRVSMRTALSSGD